MRISRPQMFMEIAHVVSRRSTCFRLNVGAVVVVANRIVSIGYNGSPPGDPHCLGQHCPGKDGCHLTTHAEENALAYVPTSLRYDDKDLYITDSPCMSCATKIVLNGSVRRVLFARPYRLTDSLELLRRNNISCYQVMPSGYVMDWHTRELIDAL